jgi:hypothetical protein
MLPTVQLWKQAMSMAHVASFRQVCVSLQHAPMMHALHGVPPGSSEQLPASGGAMPQCWPVQTRPTQHCDEVVQFDPGGRHAPAPHMPFLQTIEQQSLGPPQGRPSSWHWFDVQTPLVQTSVQQSDGCEQPAPRGAHMVAPQVNVVVLHTPSQQSEPSMQGAPSGWHAVAPQVNVCGLQKPPQHSASVMQKKPSCKHVLLQLPVSTLQMPPQHWPSVEHGKPSCAQAMQVSEIGSQIWSQQSLFFEQLPPIGWQGPPQTPPTHGLSQQSLLDAHEWPTVEQPQRPVP